MAGAKNRFRPGNEEGVESGVANNLLGKTEGQRKNTLLLNSL